MNYNVTMTTLSIANSILFNSDVKNFIDGIWGSTKDFFKSIEPYQPFVATLTILSKAAWKARSKKKVSAEIRDLENRIKILKAVHRDRGTDGTRTIVQRKYQLNCAKTDQLHTLIASLQLGSLIFPHPGSNIWNSGNTLFGRISSIRHHFAHASLEPSNPMNGKLGTLSALGTATALLKQTGTIQEYNPLCHVIIGASFVAMAIETSLMIKNWFAAKN